MEAAQEKSSANEQKVTLRESFEALKLAEEVAAEIANLKSQHKELTEEIKRMTEIYDDNVVILKNYDSITEDLKRSIEQGTLEISQSQERRDELSRERKPIWLDLDDMIAQHEEEMRPYTKMLESARDAARHAEKRLRAKESTLKDANNELRQAERDKRSAERDLDRARRAHANASNDDLPMAKANLDGCQAKLDSANSRVDMASRAVEVAESDKDSAREESKDADSRLRDAQNEYDSRRHPLDQREAPLRADVRRLDAGIKREDNLMSNLNDKLSSDKRRLEYCNRVYEDPDETTALKERIDNEQQEADQLTEEISAKEKKHSELCKAADKARRTKKIAVIAAVIVACLVVVTFVVFSINGDGRESGPTQDLRALTLTHMLNIPGDESVYVTAILPNGTRLPAQVEIALPSGASVSYLGEIPADWSQSQSFGDNFSMRRDGDFSLLAVTVTEGIGVAIDYRPEEFDSKEFAISGNESLSIRLEYTPWQNVGELRLAVALPVGLTASGDDIEFAYSPEDASEGQINFYEFFIADAIAGETYSTDVIISVTESFLQGNDSAEQEDLPVDELTQDETVDFPLSMGGEFVYASGAGGWSSTVLIKPDGTLRDISVNWGPDWTTVDAAFSEGRISDVRKVGEFEYSFHIEELTSTSEITDWAKERMHYLDDPSLNVVGIDPFGMAQGDEFMLFLAGTPISELPETFLDGAQRPFEHDEFYVSGGVLVEHALFNVTQGATFLAAIF